MKKPLIVAALLLSSLFRFSTSTPTQLSLVVFRVNARRSYPSAVSNLPHKLAPFRVDCRSAVIIKLCTESCILVSPMRNSRSLEYGYMSLLYFWKVWSLQRYSICNIWDPFFRTELVNKWHNKICCQEYVILVLAIRRTQDGHIWAIRRSIFHYQGKGIWWVYPRNLLVVWSGRHRPNMARNTPSLADQV